MSTITPLDEEYLYEDGVAISQSDLDGNIIYVNNMFCQSSGYTKDELIGAKYEILRHPDMPQEIFEKMQKALSSAQTYNATIKNLRKDGRYYWSDLEVLPIYDQNEKIKGYATINRASSRANIEEFENKNS